MSSIIQVKNLSKSYILSHQGKERYTTLRDVMAQKSRSLFSLGRSLKSTAKVTKEEFWALKDINFEVEKGDRVGIIGRNGAGKSTLLKILSRITEPTSGSIKITGRVASLLEVGTGFHPELSGRENIFLNGAILGMSRAEIRKHFDAIVDFAEIEKFLDTPVKRYSSGMYVRLAFAVAAHLEPEILIVDEVLAVGDAQFQKKCLGKMEDVSKNEGRTVLFVSHLMGSIAQLCNKGLLMDKGEIVANDSMNVVIDKYLSSGQDIQSSVFVREETDEKKDAVIKVMKLIDDNGNNISLISHTDKIILEVTIEIFKWNDDLQLGLSLQDKLGKRIFTVHSRLTEFMTGDEREKTVIYEFPSNFIVPGNYSWIAAIHIPGYHLIDTHYDICNFTIVDSGSEFSMYENSDYGYVFVNNYNIKIKQ